jgi:hypothetical protein
MAKVQIIEQRPMFRALPGVDIVFFIALGVTSLGACLVMALR